MSKSTKSAPAPLIEDTVMDPELDFFQMNPFQEEPKPSLVEFPKEQPSTKPMLNQGWIFHPDIVVDAL